MSTTLRDQLIRGQRFGKPCLGRPRVGENYITARLTSIAQIAILELEKASDSLAGVTFLLVRIERQTCCCVVVATTCPVIYWVLDLWLVWRYNFLTCEYTVEHEEDSLVWCLLFGPKLYDISEVNPSSFLPSKLYHLLSKCGLVIGIAAHGKESVENARLKSTVRLYDHLQTILDSEPWYHLRYGHLQKISTLKN